MASQKSIIIFRTSTTTTMQGATTPQNMLTHDVPLEDMSCTQCQLGFISNATLRHMFAPIVYEPLVNQMVATDAQGGARITPKGCQNPSRYYPLGLY